MQHFQIKHRYTGAVIYEGEAETLADLVGTAVKNGKSLEGIDWNDFHGCEFAPIKWTEESQ